MGGVIPRTGRYSRNSPPPRTQGWRWGFFTHGLGTVLGPTPVAPHGRVVLRLAGKPVVVRKRDLGYRPKPFEAPAKGPGTLPKGLQGGLGSDGSGMHGGKKYSSFQNT